MTLHRLSAFRSFGHVFLALILGWLLVACSPSFSYLHDTCCVHCASIARPMVNLIFIRHGESKDNIRGVWAGRKDSPLSNYGIVSGLYYTVQSAYTWLTGMQQAEALAEALADISISAIHCSDLMRAKTTANALKAKQKNHEQLILCESTSLREQNFGTGEGQKFSKKEPGVSLAEHYSHGKFPVLHSRHDRFPDGESLDDVAKRAEVVINDILIPHLLQEEDGTSKSVAIVSHGIFIVELVAAIIRRDHDLNSTIDIQQFRGMKNTAWSELKLSAKPSNTSSTASAWSVEIVGINQDAHLLNLHRQKGGIGSMTHDPKQLDIRVFLGKKTVAPKPKTRVRPY